VEVDVPAHRDEERAGGSRTPLSGAAPIAILDFLANAESVVQRLGEHTSVPDWVLARWLGREWVVLAGHGGHGLRPGDVLDRPSGVSQHLSRLASAWAADVVVDLTEGQMESVRRSVVEGEGVEHCDGLVAFPLWGCDGLFGAVCALPATAEEESELRGSEAMVRLTVELLTSVLGLDLDRSRLQRRLDAAESAALSDPMTGLGNRRSFERAVDREEARCARFGHRAGIMVLDLDGLKDTNDTWGHQAGDELLRRAGDTIRATLRSADQAFRIGGDEFALLLPEVTDEGLHGVYDRLGEALAAAGVAASVGSAIRQPAGNLQVCVREADAEMYERKRQRTGGGQSRRPH
jgi:diguanylate cyclase